MVESQAFAVVLFGSNSSTPLTDVARIALFIQLPHSLSNLCVAVNFSPVFTSREAGGRPKKYDSKKRGILLVVKCSL
jgi:hypothetical protein